MLRVHFSNGSCLTHGRKEGGNFSQFLADREKILRDGRTGEPYKLTSVGKCDLTDVERGLYETIIAQPPPKDAYHRASALQNLIDLQSDLEMHTAEREMGFPDGEVVPTRERGNKCRIVSKHSAPRTRLAHKVRKVLFDGLSRD